MESRQSAPRRCDAALAGAIEARCRGANVLVSVAMDKIVFHQPVYVGDLISFWSETLRIGNTSITVKVVVEANRYNDPNQKVLVTEAQRLRKPRRRPETNDDSAGIVAA